MQDGHDAAIALVNKLCVRKRHLVKEELMLLAAQVNAAFVRCESLSAHEAFARRLAQQQPTALVEILHEAIIEGEPLAHILLELLVHLSFNEAVSEQMVRVGLVETLTSVLSVLPDVARPLALQLLDNLTDPAHEDPRHPCQRIRRLCTSTSLRVLLSLLNIGALASHTTSCPDEPQSETHTKCLTLVITLLDRVLDALVTDVAMGRAPSCAIIEVLAHAHLRTVPDAWSRADCIVQRVQRRWAWMLDHPKTQCTPNLTQPVQPNDARRHDTTTIPLS